MGLASTKKPVREKRREMLAKGAVDLRLNREPASPRYFYQ